MNKKIKFKTSSISKSYPFKIKKIKLADIDWEINNDHTTFILKDCKFPIIEDVDKSDIIFSIYAYESDSEAFIYKSLDKVETFPIIFDFVERGLVLSTNKRYFRIQLINKTNERIIASTTDILLADKDQVKSNLPMLPGEISNRIAVVKFEQDGPILYISKNFRTKDGNSIYYKKLSELIDEYPTFTCSFFPIILDQIFTKAYQITFIEKDENKNWAKRWIKWANILVPGVFPEDIDLDIDDSFFERKLFQLSDAWIGNYNFDQKLFDELMN